jgi:prolyl 4-hydroxylase
LLCAAGASSIQLDDDSLTTCESSDFKYKPRAGDALLFYSMNLDRSIDPRALHGACPVSGSSEKWVVTKWLHDKPINGWDGEADTAQVTGRSE